MTSNQKQQFNKMLLQLRRISKDYQTSDQLRSNAGQYGLEFKEEIGMAYDNIQAEAGSCVKDIREIK